MSIVKTNRIVGSNTPLPEVDGLQVRQSILATTQGQTEFNITVFNDRKNIRAFVAGEEVDVSWVDGKAKLARGVEVGEQVDFYGFGDRFASDSEFRIQALESAKDYTDQELGTITNALATKANASVQITAGEGLTGGGNLTTNRTLSVNFATAAQAQALTASDVALTPATLGSAMDAHVMGRGQTWQVVTSSRALNTNYTNTTGKPIYVTWHPGITTGTATVSIDVDGSSMCSAFIDTDTFNVNTLSTIVPPGATYRFSVVAGTLQKGLFREYR